MPVNIPAEAPNRVARFQKMPKMRAGKNPEAAKENAAAIKKRMSAGFCCATNAASNAMIRSTVFDTFTLLLTDAVGSIIL